MSAPQSGVRIGVDIGGTFTDLVAITAAGEIHTHKTLTTADPADGVLSAVSALLTQSRIAPESVMDVLHATTLASNLVLERKGPPVALLTTEGFRDVLEIQRSLRYSMYDVQIEKPQPLTPRSNVFEVPERIGADGTVVRHLDHDSVAAIGDELRKRGITTVAVAFLHSYAYPDHEIAAGEVLSRVHPEARITLSSRVSNEAREYERMNTAVVNAYVAPTFGHYLGRLEHGIRQLGISAPVWVMQSSGGLASTKLAAELAVRTIESGPAAGALMSAEIARLLTEDVISFDMGGTTAKATTIRGGELPVTHRLEIDRHQMREGSGLPINIPACDLVEIGAGGGSIASAEYGVLQVGPRSAGSLPGPACYGRGGADPTVTDANLVLGYLNPGGFAGGAFKLDVEAAASAFRALGSRLGMGAREAAWAVHELVTFEMEKAIRMVSIDRGFDPRDFTLICFGGAGPAHGSRLARALGIRRMVIPSAAGVGSALGLLASTESVEFSFTRPVDLSSLAEISDLDAVFQRLTDEAQAMVTAARDEYYEQRYVGVRYQGQGGEVKLSLNPSSSPDDVIADFNNEYLERYGAKEKLPVEANTWYLELKRRRSESARLLATNGRIGTQPVARSVYMPETGPVTINPVRRVDMGPGDALAGPNVIEDSHTTIVLLPGDSVLVGPQGDLIVEVGG